MRKNNSPNAFFKKSGAENADDQEKGVRAKGGLSGELKCEENSTTARVTISAEIEKPRKPSCSIQ